MVVDPWGTVVTTAPTASVSPTRPSIRRVSQPSAARFHRWQTGALRPTVAGGIEISRDRAPRVLTSRDQPSAFRPRLRGDLCSWRRAGRRGGANLAPAPTLPVVTATAGPPPVPTPGEQQRYIVREGDTLSGSPRFGVSEDAILKENPSPIAIASSSGRNW